MRKNTRQRKTPAEAEQERERQRLESAPVPQQRAPRRRRAASIDNDEEAVAAVPPPSAQRQRIAVNEQVDNVPEEVPPPPANPVPVAAEPAQNANVPLVQLHCVAEGTRLRMRIITPGYLPNANCQCPRDIREAGAYYTVPAADVELRAHGSSGTYFYRVNGRALLRVDHIQPVAMQRPVMALPRPVFQRPPSFAQPTHAPVQQEVKVTKVFHVDDTCIVCLENPTSIVFAPCGHFCACSLCGHQLQADTRYSYERDAKGRCPMCRVPIQALVAPDKVG